MRSQSTKKCLLAPALLGLLFAVGCAANGKNGNGAARVAVSPTGESDVGLTLQQQFTATVTGVANTAVTWSLTQGGSNCSPGCGSIDASGLYTAPAAMPNSPSLTVTATSQANDAETASATVKVLPISVSVMPGLKNFPIVISGVQTITQQFTSTVTPDNAPQTVSWSLACDAGANLCGSIDQNGLYTAPNTLPSPATAHVTATSTLATNPASSTTVDIAIVNSRLSGSSTYAFRFTGFDSGGGSLAITGNFSTSADGTAIIGGSEDELTTAQHVRRTIDATSSFTQDNNDHGTLSLHTTAGTRSYSVVFSGDGSGLVLETDASAHGSGEVVRADNKKFNNSIMAGQSFVFGVTGLDPGLKRAGYAGFFAADATGTGIGTAKPGLLDINDGGALSSSTNVTGNYTINSDGSGTLSLTANDLGETVNFEVYVVGGGTKASNPLTLFAISSDDPQVQAAVSGQIVLQDSTVTYDNSAVSGAAVTNLTGLDATGSHSNVALTLAAADGAGNLNGNFDQNNGGNVLSVTSFSYKYAAANPAGCTNCGRYTVQLLGNPSANPAVPPLNFVMYASTTSRGFVLEAQAADLSVLTGTMDPQKGSFFAPSELAGAYAAGTTSTAVSAGTPAVANLLLTSPGNAVFDVTGTRYFSAAGQSLTGTYDVNTSGIGTIALTAPGAENYVLYLLDATDFLIINTDATTTNPSVIVGRQ